MNPTRITLTDTALKTYTVVVKATNAGGTVSSATSGSVTTVNPYSTTTLSGKTPLIAYTFRPSAISGNIVTNSVDSNNKLYLYNGAFAKQVGSYYALDVSNGPNNNAVTWVSGKTSSTWTGAKALINSSTSSSHIAISVTSSSYTITQWVYFYSYAGNAYTTNNLVFNFGLPSNGYAFSAFYSVQSYANQTSGGWFIQNSGTGSQYSTTTTLPTMNTWYFVSFSINTNSCYSTFTKASGTFSEGTITTSNAFTPSNPLLLSVGGVTPGGDPYMNMMIADYRLYGSVLTTADLAGIFAAGAQ